MHHHGAYCTSESQIHRIDGHPRVQGIHGSKEWKLLADAPEKGCDTLVDAGGFNLFEKYARQIGSFPRSRRENKKYLKPKWYIVGHYETFG